MIKDEAQVICAAMGNVSESHDEFVKAHKTILNDMMYIPTWNTYNLSSVPRNMEKLSVPWNEFKNVKNRLNNYTKKATKLE